MKAEIITYNALVKDRKTRLEAIGEEVHFWQYDVDAGEQFDILLDNQDADMDMIDFLHI